MKVFANREIRNLFQAVLAVWAVALALTQGIVWHTTHVFSFGLLLVFLLLGGCLWGVLFRYFQRQSALLEQAVQANPKLSGWQLGCTTGLRPGGRTLPSVSLR